MTSGSAAHRVSTISELTRLVACQLVLITGLKSAVNFACACRHLEEPVLSTLWETQSSVRTLLKVFPSENLNYDNYARTFRIFEDPSPEAWIRFQRYASWMHQAHVYEGLALSEGVLRKLRLNSPTGGWFPALQDLSWCITQSNLPYIDLFLSPHLKKIYISTPKPFYEYDSIPHNILPAIASVISVLPTSALRRLRVEPHLRDRTTPWAYFEDSLSSVALRCGPSLVEFASPIPLSEAAVNHLIQLPHLRIWRIQRPPPSYSASSLPLVFPPLTEFILGEGASGWLSLFGRLEEGVSVSRNTTPLSKVKESLESLLIRDVPSPIINISFTSLIRIFRNLVRLILRVHCHEEGDDGQCAFKLDNDGVAELAVALPQVGYLGLGQACSKNTCATTVACLLPISIHCTKLRTLEIHFNTTNIVDDLRTILEDPRLQGRHSLPRCMPLYLFVWDIPLALDESDLETVAKGMIGIFPSLKLFARSDVLSEKIEELLKV